MTRHALIITNPGEAGAENYCAGVNKDAENYRGFLLSPIGGYWQESEIKHLHRPTLVDVRQEIKTLPYYDYVVVVFSGHGWYSTTIRSTVLILRQGQEMDCAEFRACNTKQTMIIDCCREESIGLPLQKAVKEGLARAATQLHPADCRLYYDKRVEECSNELVVTYACGISERSGDDSQRGGVYSYSLLDASIAWAQSLDIDTARFCQILAVPAAHDLAVPRVQRIRAGRQTPAIEKPRSGPYFPFCIVA